MLNQDQKSPWRFVFSYYFLEVGDVGAGREDCMTYCLKERLSVILLYCLAKIKGMSVEVLDQYVFRV